MRVKRYHTAPLRHRTVQRCHIRVSDHGLRPPVKPFQRHLRQNPRQPVPTTHAPHGIDPIIVQCPLQIVQPLRITPGEISSPSKHVCAAYGLATEGAHM